MSKTCAVCKQGKGPEICEVCGFTDGGEINKELLDGDAEHWLETVVKPYRVQWKARERESELLAQLEEAKKREAELVSKINVPPPANRLDWKVYNLLGSVIGGVLLGVFVMTVAWAVEKPERSNLFFVMVLSLFVLAIFLVVKFEGRLSNPLVGWKAWLWRIFRWILGILGFLIALGILLLLRR